MEFGFLHGDADRALLLCPLRHAERLQNRTDICLTDPEKTGASADVWTQRPVEVDVSLSARSRDLVSVLQHAPHLRSCLVLMLQCPGYFRTALLSVGFLLLLTRGALTDAGPATLPIRLTVENDLSNMSPETHLSSVVEGGVLLGVLRRLQETQTDFKFTLKEDPDFGPWLESVNGVAGNEHEKTYWEILSESSGEYSRLDELAATNLKQMSTSSLGSAPGSDGDEQAEVFSSDSSGQDHEARATGVPHHRAHPPVITVHFSIIVHIGPPTVHCHTKQRKCKGTKLHDRLIRPRVSYLMSIERQSSYLCTGTCSRASSSLSLRSDLSSAPGAAPYNLLNKGALTRTNIGLL
ncbi:hypothetical protein FQN60_000880 [Etheostoma spectabile]|uniref:Uncharacterized protein n=1 Tax=Etheostoma spectabile TaxID=54343 RepID=A0A5J5D136_9PERO|nr:hypothetical protein FQN60_000880 [Etheostoma spectabile]